MQSVYLRRGRRGMERGMQVKSFEILREAFNDGGGAGNAEAVVM